MGVKRGWIFYLRKYVADLGFIGFRWLGNGSFALALGFLLWRRPSLLHGWLFWLLGPKFITFLKWHIL